MYADLHADAVAAHSLISSTAVPYPTSLSCTLRGAAMMVGIVCRSIAKAAMHFCVHVLTGLQSWELMLGCKAGPLRAAGSVMRLRNAHAEAHATCCTPGG
jgi:hypothetical protein